MDETSTDVEDNIFSSSPSPKTDNFKYSFFQISQREPRANCYKPFVNLHGPKHCCLLKLLSDGLFLNKSPQDSEALNCASDSDLAGGGGCHWQDTASIATGVPIKCMYMPSVSAVPSTAAQPD